MLKKRQLAGCAAALFVILSSSFAMAEGPNKYVEIMLDASGSMQAQVGGEAKIAIAKRVLSEIVESMKGRTDLDIGVRIYGHQFNKSANNCQDTKLELPFAPPDPQKIQDLISRIKAQGYTPIAYSLGEAAKDFPGGAGLQKTIILITDGLESCNGDPCAAARALAAAGVGVKMHVVGFDLKAGELEKLKCLTEPSGGLLLSAKDAGELKGALDEVMNKAVKDNLIVTLMGSDGKTIAGYVEVYAAGTDKKVDTGSAGGAGTGSYEKAAIKVPAGTYDLLAQSHVTSQRQWVRGVAVTDDGVTEKTVSFAAGKISGIARKTDGSPVAGYVEILQNDGVEDKFINANQSGATPAIFNVLPGTYKVKITDDRTKEVKVFDGVVVAADQSVSKEASFGEGTVSVIAKDAAGNPTPALIEAKKMPENAFVRYGQSGAEPFIFYLAPGTYRFIVTDDKTKTAKTIDDISVVDGQVIKKEVSF
jgi:Ca-activated chloride channel family protein